MARISTTVLMLSVAFAAVSGSPVTVPLAGRANAGTAATAPTSSPGTPAGAGAGNTSANPNSNPNPNLSCEAALLLGQGISLNIADQKDEQVALAQVSQQLQQPTQPGGFESARTRLLGLVNAGIAIRQMNQQIAPAESAARPGIARVANAQLDELDLVRRLTGDPATDAALVRTLQKDFAGGVQQNMANLAAAQAGCAGSTTAATM